LPVERLLRWAAIAIAVLAAIDPPILLTGKVSPRVCVVVQDGPTMELPAADSSITRRQRAAQTLDELKRQFGREFDLIEGLPDSAAPAIVVGDRYPERPFADSAIVSTVTLSAPLTPNVRIAAIDAPVLVPPETGVRVSITVEAAGMAGSRSGVVVRAGGAGVGRSTHEWTNDAETWTPEIVAAPVGAPPFSFEIAVGSEKPEITDKDNRAVADVGLAPRMRVFVLEARPSWASAFVRRALESDLRFEVAGFSQPSPRVGVSSGDASSAPSNRVDRFDAFDVVVAGGLDRLSANQVAALEHFAVERGGGLALVPDLPLPALVAHRLIPSAELSQRLIDRPTTLPTSPPIDASELLEAMAIPPAASVLARGPGSSRPIVWTGPLGDGRVLFSGAMDAWRFRGRAGEPFDRFWQSTIAALAIDARHPIDIAVKPGRAAPGETVRVTARVRKLERDRLGNRLSIGAKVRGETVRLWPEAPEGSFSGQFVVDPGTSERSLPIAVSLGDGSAEARARLPIDANPRHDDRPPLGLLAASHKGVNVGPGGVQELKRFLQATTVAATERRTRNPMRSSWWLVPFAGCLAAEWWLRRKAGRR
jgi:hypothetical protein